MILTGTVIALSAFMVAINILLQLIVFNYLFLLKWLDFWKGFYKQEGKE